ncbi:right-handed parallel beta-helix repeat-containing protein [Steroidobacter flavus]|uniref:right-handed parallel beta-helix repeat-containing protein n=1 Tax=Steroidobacter flavus TaxID=1842136 RepID=UPI0036D37E14
MSVSAASVSVASAGDSSAAGFGAARQREARVWKVCPAATTASDCDFKGDQAIPNAVARASNGDTIQIRAGRYTPRAYQDVPFRDLVVRSFVIIDDKDISLIGEQGVILAGNDKLPMSAIVVRNADVSIAHLEITSFNYQIEEDKIYDGHGIFVIDSKARIDDVTVSKFQKMGLTGRGDTQLDVSNLRVLDGHVGVWLHENAYLRLRNALVRGNDSSAITAYDNSAAHISGSTVEGNARYGLYANQQAAVFVSNTKVAGNKLGDVNALADSHIRQDRL